jgi:hypothetical protein
METVANMNTRLRPRALLAMLLTLSTAGCGLTLRPDEPRAIGPVEVVAGGRHDACVELERGDRVDFRFQALPALAFSISYRDEQGLTEPLVHTPSEVGSGFFVAAEAHLYCFSWKAASDAPAVSLLRYRLSLQAKR